MSSLNKAILIGRVGKNPEYFSSDKGSCLVIALATSFTYKKKNSNDYESVTDWHTIKFFGKKADSIKNVCRKGDMINILGRITKEDYKDKNGVDKVFPIIIGDAIQVLVKYKSDVDSKPNEEGDVNPPSNEIITSTDEEDDLPF